MDLTDIIYSNDYINILIQNYVAHPGTRLR